LTVYLKQLQNYCSYQERCHKEVRNKLLEVGCSGTLLEEVIFDLMQENYLNEERYAQHYARGKFRMLKWGKVKISQGLKANGVTEFCIQKGLQEIDDKEYKQCFEKLFEKKCESLKKERMSITKKNKVKNYLLSKGYESRMVMSAVMGMK
jgi:regulatory protein